MVWKSGRSSLIADELCKHKTSIILRCHHFTVHLHEAKVALTCRTEVPEAVSVEDTIALAWGSIPDSNVGWTLDELTLHSCQESELLDLYTT